MSKLPRILVVDDHPDILFLWQTVLEDKSYECTPANSIEQAKELIQSHCFDLMITDYEIGSEVADELILFWQEYTQMKPAILHTGYDGFRKREHLQIPVFKKPEWDEIVDLIQKKVRRSFS